MKVKKLVSVALSVAIAGSCAAVSSYAFGGVYGDADGNGDVNSSDALVVLNHAVGSTLLTGDRFICGDVNADGSINSVDALDILKYSVGLIDEFKAEGESELTADEALKLYADALIKAKDSRPMYRYDISSKRTAENVESSGGLLALVGGEDSFNESLKKDISKVEGPFSSLVASGSNSSYNRLPAFCKLEDASVLENVKIAETAEGNYAIEFKLADEDNVTKGSPFYLMLGSDMYDGLEEELGNMSSVGAFSMKTKIARFTAKDVVIKCTINPETMTFVDLQWNMNTAADVEMSMSGLNVSFSVVDLISKKCSEFNYGIVQ